MCLAECYKGKGTRHRDRSKREGPTGGGKAGSEGLSKERTPEKMRRQWEGHSG